MNIYKIALFGESEKGEYYHPYVCKDLTQLIDYLGNPPESSKGLFYAVQALLYQRELIFLRIREEGFNYTDYSNAIQTLEEKNLTKDISAFCLPGVGCEKILEMFIPICSSSHSILITNESDFYDYVTSYS